MTPRSLRTLLAAGALGLTLTVSACGDSEPAASPPSAEPSTTAASPTETADSPPPSSESPAGPSLDVTIKGDQVDPTNKSFEVTSGQTLTLVVTSDRAGELHVHSSPEQSLEFGPGRTSLEVTLNQPGQVDIEEHESDALIARVLVK